jgi:hypothetical protein
MVYLLIGNMVDGMPAMQLEPKKQHGLFGDKKKPAIPGPTDQFTELGRRLRTLEGRYTDLQTKSQVMEQNMLHSHKRLLNQLKPTNSDVREVKKELQEIKERMLSLIQELQSCAKKEEVKVLQKYVHLWEPMNFVTRDEVKDIIAETMGKSKRTKKK